MDITTLPFKPYAPKGDIRHNTKEFTLPENLFLEQWVVPKGITVRLITSQNFGIIVLPKDCQDTRGFTIPRKLFRF